MELPPSTKGITDADAAAYTLQFSHFLEADMKFRAGMVFYGIYACAFLLQCYRIRFQYNYAKKHPEKSSEFQSHIIETRNAIWGWITNGNYNLQETAKELKCDPKEIAFLGYDGFSEIEVIYDNTVQEFYKIINE